DDGAGSDVLGGGAGLELADAVAQAIAEDVIDGALDDGAGAGGALLAVEAEGRGDHAVDGAVHIAVGGDDDGVLAAHLEDGALDEALARLGARGALVDLQADLFGAGEGDEVDLGAFDEEAAGFGTALQEVDHAVGEAGFGEERDEAGGDGGG